MFKKMVGSLSSFVLSAGACAMNCPDMPQQTTRDYSGEVEIAAAKVGPVRGPSVSAAAKRQATEVLSRYPNADKVYVMQMMTATYCSAIDADRALPEGEKAARFEAFSSGVLAAMYGPQKLVHTPPMNAKPRTQKTTAEPLKRPKPSATSPLPSHVDVAKNAPVQMFGWLDKSVTLAVRYSIHEWPHSCSLQPYGQSSISTTWREIFGILSPHLLSRPEDGQLRKTVSALLTEKYIKEATAQGVGCSILTEDDWQGISVRFRTNGLAKVEYLDTTAGGSALFWNETPSGIALMKHIRVQ